MAYLRQLPTVKRLQQSINADMEAVRGRWAVALRKEWTMCRRDLIAGIVHVYTVLKDRGGWNRNTLVMTGMEQQLKAYIRRRLAQFHASSVVIMRQAFVDIKKKSALRHAWLLDQVVPDNKKVRLPDYARSREAQLPGDPEIWVDRWGAWLDAYSDALGHNVAMNAMNEGGLDDAMAEVDATRVNTPAYPIQGAMERLFDFEAFAAQMRGEDDIAQYNEDLIDEEIWMVSARANICEDCLDNEGKTADEVGDDIPLHPNCNCYWEMHPKSYADLLRSGDPAEKELAYEMTRRGLDEGSLVIRDEKSGDIAAKVLINFTDWLQGAMVLSGGYR
jgi:hypothetical protein